MARALIRRRPKPSQVPCDTYTAAAELLDTVISFMCYAESVIKPALIAPGKNFTVVMSVLVGGDIEL